MHPGGLRHHITGLVDQYRENRSAISVPKARADSRRQLLSTQIKKRMWVTRCAPMTSNQLCLRLAGNRVVSMRCGALVSISYPAKRAFWSHGDGHAPLAQCDTG